MPEKKSLDTGYKLTNQDDLALDFNTLHSQFLTDISAYKAVNPNQARFWTVLLLIEQSLNGKWAIIRLLYYPVCSPIVQF